MNAEVTDLVIRVALLNPHRPESLEDLSRRAMKILGWVVSDELKKKGAKKMAKAKAKTKTKKKK